MDAFFVWLEGIGIASQWIAPILVITCVSLFLLFYICRYRYPAHHLRKELRRLGGALKALANTAPAERRSAVAALFVDHELKHAWKEYSESLHDQFEVREGEQRLLRSRATIGANSFFTAQSVVETPLGTEFYKHLPGMLTGIGIVGTFFGLMLGLQHFNPGSPEMINDSVAQLLRDVFFAFLGSFISILASIVVTFSEKHQLALCYKLLEQLNENIDGLFNSGVGEEYLAELVKSSNESSIQTRQLKDSLVTDLREMLQNLVDTQVRENLKLAETLSTSYRDSGQLLAEQIGGAIENSLKSPLEAIAGAVQTASGDQSSQVQHLLQDVLTAFMNKLENSFGQQFNGLQEMLGQSMTAMQGMQQGFNDLVQNMRTASESASQNSAGMIAQLLADMQAGQNSMQAGMNEMLANLQTSIARIGSEGEGAGERMAQQLEKLFADSEARQRSMAESLEAFVDTMKQTMGAGQQEAMTKIADSVDTLGHQLASLFKQLEAGQAQMDQASRAAQGSLHEGTREIIGSLEQQVQQLLDAVAEQSGAVQDTVQALSAQTAQHLQEMQLGADKMRTAAERFETAGHSVTRAGEATAGVLGAMQGAGTEIAGASRELGSVVTDYRNNRDALAKTLSVIESVVSGAQGEAAGRTQYLADLKQQGERLQALNREVHDYLEQISSVLGKGFGDFTEGVDRSLKHTLGSLDTQLATAVTHLAGGVQSVSESLDDFSDIMDRIQKK